MSEFKIGDVVRLRSGGPMMTVTAVFKAIEAIETLYHNSVEGTFSRAKGPNNAFILATTSPEIPEDAARMRGTSVAKSSLS